MTDALRSTVHDPSGRSGGDDLPALHAREIDRLVAYLFSSDRALGTVDAEAIAQQAFLELRATWPGTGGHPSHQVHLFATAHRIASTWPRRPATDGADPLKDSAPAYWDRADVNRLIVLQDCLDRVPDVPRRVVLLRELCGFTPAECALIISVPESAVENARGDGLRALVPMIEAQTSSGQARRGPLVPEDFGALARVLQVGDGRVAAERARFSATLGQNRGDVTQPAPIQPPGRPVTAPAPAPPTVSAPVAAPVAPAPDITQLFAAPPGPAPLGSQALGRPAPPPGAPLAPASGPAPASAAFGDDFGTGAAPRPVPVAPIAPAPLPPAATPAAPAVPAASPTSSLSQVTQPMYQAPPTYQPSSSPTYSPSWADSTLIGGPASGLVSIGTPIFDSVSAWFSSGGGNAWAALDDAAWQEASRRAAAAPRFEDSTSVGLPRRRPGANTVPSASEAMSRSMFGPASGQIDASAVRSRLGGFQDGLLSARRLREEGSEPIAVEAAEALEAAFESNDNLFTAPGTAPSSGPNSPRPRFQAPPTPAAAPLARRPSPVQHAAPPTAPPPTAPPPSAPSHAAPSAQVPSAQAPSAQVPAEPAPGSASGSAPTTGGTRSSEVRGFGVFYRDYLPQLLAQLMVEGARPALAAEIAQDVMSAAYREWARIDKPREWTRDRALAAWADRRDDSAPDGL